MSKLKTGKAGSSSSSPSVSRVRDAKAFRDYASPSLPTSDASPLMHATCLADAPGTTRPIKLPNPINAPKLPRSGEITLALKDKIGKMLDPVALNVSLPIELELTRTEACRTLLNNGVLVPSEELAKNAREKIRKRLVSIWSTSETRDLYEDIPNLLEEDRKFQYVPREVALTLELSLLMFFAPYGFRASISSGQTESTLLELSTNPQFLAKYMHALVTVRDTLFKARGAFVIEENTPTLKKTPILSLRIAKELSSGTPLCQLTDTGDLTPEAAYEQKALVHPGKDLRSGKRKTLTEFHNRYHKNHPGTALCPKGLWPQGPANDRSWDWPRANGSVLNGSFTEDQANRLTADLYETPDRQLSECVNELNGLTHHQIASLKLYGESLELKPYMFPPYEDDP